MLQKIATSKARNNFADLLGKVYYGKKKFLIERQGKPFAVLINFEEYKVIEKAKKFFLKKAFINRSKNKDVPQGQVLSDVKEAVTAVRKLKR